MKGKKKDGQTVSNVLSEITSSSAPIFVNYNQQHNLVVVRTSDRKALEEIEKLVAQLDRPTPQVLLEMKILEVTLDDNFRSIFDHAGLLGPQTFGLVGPAVPINPLAFNGATTPAGTVAQNVAGLGNFQLEGGQFIYQFLNQSIQSRIQLLATENRINLLGTPLILASNNRPARVFVGNETVLTTGVQTDVVTGGLGQAVTAIQPVTEVRNVGLTLAIVPKINADRTVTLQISQDNSTVQPDGASIPVPTANGGVTDFPIDTVNTANLISTVVAKDGLTIAVGGLIRNQVVSNIQKVPLLGDLRFVGFFFRRQQQQVRKVELILLITPYIMVMPGEAETVSWDRLQKLSFHPFKKYGDQGLDVYFENDVTPDYCRPPLLCPSWKMPEWLEPLRVPPQSQPPALTPPQSGPPVDLQHFGNSPLPVGTPPRQPEPRPQLPSPASTPPS
ncbi:MAG: hypothetical protein KatS3mg105_2369 [Gemmatales bacterium]|nr:MAG: hypothetical protein KatS3mg105_2369 [Gemmatales bacterium]